MATFNNNRNNNQWTEVVHNKKKQQHYFNEGLDPFAGMNTSIDYEQEIERLKQLVPKNKRKQHHYIPHYHSNTISRSNSPDTTHSTTSSSSSVDSDVSSLSDQYVTDQEKLRFFTFVRNWTSDSKKQQSIEEFYSSADSLWADRSPWNRSIPINPPTIKAQLPIGTGRRIRH